MFWGQRSFKCNFDRNKSYFRNISNILNRESLKNDNNDWLIWNYLLKYFSWQSTVIAWFYLLKMVSKMAARLLYVWKYVSAIQLCGC